MRILVTGGAGFIGSRLVRGLIRDEYPGLTGAAVTVLDKLTYCGSADNLRAVASSPRFRFVRGDICDAVLVDRVLPGHDVVVHCAAETHVDRSLHDGATFVRTNVVGTEVLLDAALRHRTGRFLQVSTDEVYGSIDTGSWTEEQPLAPSSPYSASKAAADLLVLSYHRSYGLATVITRCCNNYGPNQYPEKLIPLFVTSLLDAQPVPLYGDGGNVREWLHVDDHCRGIAVALTRGRAGEVYHIGGGAELTNRELTARLLAASGKDWELVRMVDDRKGHDRRYALNGDKAAAELGYRPQVSMTDGLPATVRWYRDNTDWWRPRTRRTVLAGAYPDAPRR